MFLNSLPYHPPGSNTMYSFPPNNIPAFLGQKKNQNSHLYSPLSSDSTLWKFPLQLRQNPWKPHLHQTLSKNRAIARSFLSRDWQSQPRVRTITIHFSYNTNFIKPIFYSLNNATNFSFNHPPRVFVLITLPSLSINTHEGTPLMPNKFIYSLNEHKISYFSKIRIYLGCRVSCTISSNATG